MITVMIAAAGMALRVGLRALLQGAAEAGSLRVAAEAASLESPLPEVDVILAAGELVVNIPATEGERVPALLVLASGSEAARAILRRWPGQLWGALDEDSSAEELRAALMAVANGLRAGSPGLLDSLLSGEGEATADADGANSQLTGREREVLQLLAQGLANKQISGVLGISEHTVKFHISAIYAKLGVSSRTEAVRAGVKQGLVAL